MEFLLIALVVTSIFLVMFILSQRELADEEGKVPLFETICSGSYDSIHFTFPFVRFCLYEDFIVFAYGSKNFTLKLNEIECIGVQNSIFQKGLVFFHNKSSLPKRTIIISRKKKEIIKLLNNKGVRIMYW